MIEPPVGPTLAELGEFGLIDRLRAVFPLTAAVQVGPGDDAAVVRTPDGRVVATTDLLVEGRHFRLDWSSPRDVGHKAAAQNLSDVAAMGARPVALLVGLGAPPTLPVDLADELAAGLAAECAVVGATVVGGDVVRSEALVVAVTALGDLDGRTPVLRSGARAGDRLLVAGLLGGSAAGLAALLAGEAEQVPGLVAAHRRPAPPYAAGPLLADAGATSLIDVSDGFAADLGHVLRASGVGAVVDVSALPGHPDLGGAWALGRGSIEVSRWLTSGGEDHALVATVAPGRADAAAKSCRSAGIPCAVVGEVDDSGLLRWVGLPDGADEPAGYDHFGGRP